MMRGLIFPLLAALSFAPFAVLAEGDVERGKKVFKKCASCHMLGEKARNRAGPPLNNIIAMPAGSVEGFRYSKALKAAADGGLIWTAEALDGFLADPKGMIPKTKMSFRGLKKPQDRADVIAYVATFSEGATAAEVEAGFVVSADILAIEGDAEYGEYLSSECTTCHQASGGDAGIPSIIGLAPEDFVTALHAYRAKHRDNQVMQMIAGRMADDEIAALAAYFKDLKN